MARVSRRELLTLLEDAHATTSGVPGVHLMREHVIDVVLRALTNRRTVEVHEIDAILAAASETREYRFRLELGDPYSEQRARCIDVCTRLRAELVDLAPLRSQLCDASHATQSLALGGKIRAARRQAGFTQTQLADKLEVNQTTVGRWERGVLVPNHRHRWRLADLLGGGPAHYEE